MRTKPLEPLPSAPVLLYRHERVQFFYTSANLLHPEEFGKPGQFARSVIFDTWPAGENAPGSGRRVSTWIVRIWKAIISSGDSSSVDFDAADSFRSELGSTLALDRGGAKLFEIPPESSFRLRSGITHLATIAVRIPADEVDTGNKTPQLFGQGMGNAFRMLVEKGNPSAGVPRILVRSTVGETGSRLSSWTSMLKEVDALARATGMRTILYGGWSPEPKVHELTDSAFRSAWETHKGDLRRQGRSVTHEKLRLGGLIVFAALLTWHVRRSAYNWKRIVALAALAGGFAYSIAQVGDWSSQYLEMSAGSVFAVEAVMAIVLGIFIESIVRFDPRKILAAEDRER